MRQLSVFILLILSLYITPLAAENSATTSSGSVQKFQYKKALEESQKAIGNRLSNVRLTDAAGRGLKLHELHGKPLVLSLIYTSCYQICPMTTKHLAKVVDKARTALGHDSFNVAVLGFDTQFDSPQAMLSFARKQGIDDAGWYLLSADADTVAALSKELGFMFFTSPNGFDHVIQATVIDAQGVIYRQVYGEVFDTPLLVEPLKELVLGRPQPNQTLLEDLVKKVRFFCTSYDPATDSYHFDYSLFIGMVIGALVILSIVTFLIREHRRSKRRKQA